MRISIGKLLLICVAAFGVAYGITMFRSYRSTGGFEEKRQQIQQLEHQNLELQREIENERSKLKRLEDPDELKLEIERHLKLVPEGSKEFVVQDGESTGSTPAKPTTKPKQ
jgi:hypothetical protein